MLRQLFLLHLLMLSIPICAQIEEIDGVVYVYDEYTKTCEAYSSPTCKGDLVFRSSFDYEGESYPVKKISSISGSKIASVTIEEGIETVEYMGDVKDCHGCLSQVH